MHKNPAVHGYAVSQSKLHAAGSSVLLQSVATMWQKHSGLYSLVFKFNWDKFLQDFWDRGVMYKDDLEVAFIMSLEGYDYHSILDCGSSLNIRRLVYSGFGVVSGVVGCEIVERKIVCAPVSAHVVSQNFEMRNSFKRKPNVQVQFKQAPQRANIAKQNRRDLSEMQTIYRPKGESLATRNALVDIQAQRVDPIVEQKQRPLVVEKLVRNKPVQEKKKSNVALNKAEMDYVKTIFDPWDISTARIPNIYPIATSLFHVSGVMNFTSGSAGYAMVYFCPWDLVNTIEVYTAGTGDTISQQSLGLVESTVPQNTAGYNFINTMDFLVTNPVNATSYTSENGNCLMGRYRIVSAGFKIRNTSNANTRSGYMTTGHSLLDVNLATATTLREQTTATTKGVDYEQSVVYVPHDPSCHDFYGYNVSYSTTTFWTETVGYTVAIDSVPADLRSNWCYAAISSSVSQNYEVTYAINIEYVPTPSYTSILNPVITARGSANKAIEAIVTASPKSSLWDGLSDVLYRAGARAVDFLGGVATKALDRYLP
jgi:hypothetical protein